MSDVHYSQPIGGLTQSVANPQENAKRIGGEIPLNVDRLGPSQLWNMSWHTFSNGRAALAWLINGNVKSVAVCAYTCPKLVAFLRRKDLDVRLYDVGAEPPKADWVIIPALFGSPPWIPLHGNMILDAAQTAFGHVDYYPSDHGAVLSCPRKCTELADGAVLSLGKYTVAGGDISDTEPAQAAVDKMAARSIWTSRGKPEEWALWWNGQSDGKWPEVPTRMMNQSRATLEKLDRYWHKHTRVNNAATLTEAIGKRLPRWRLGSYTPFSLPIFIGNPEELIVKLKKQRIFLTRLWPNASFDPMVHKNALWMAAHLVSLPVDQRHDVEDMKRLAKAVLEVATPPVLPPDGMKGFLA